MEYDLSAELAKTSSKINHQSHPAQEEWYKVTLALPSSFYVIWKKTLEAYKILNDTDKVFPAFQAMVLEAYNSLPEEIRRIMNLEEQRGESRTEEVDPHS